MAAILGLRGAVTMGLAAPTTASTCLDVDHLGNRTPATTATGNVTDLAGRFEVRFTAVPLANADPPALGRGYIGNVDETQR